MAIKSDQLQVRRVREHLLKQGKIDLLFKTYKKIIDKIYPLFTLQVHISNYTKVQMQVLFKCVKISITTSFSWLWSRVIFHLQKVVIYVA